MSQPAESSAATGSWTTWWISLLRRPMLRLSLLLMLHVVLFAGIYAFAYFARYNFEVTRIQLSVFLLTVGPVIGIKLLVFYAGNHFHGWWRYVTFSDLVSLFKVSIISMVAIAFIGYFALPTRSAVPRLSIILDAVATVLVVGGLRSSWRFVDEVFGTTMENHKRRPAILIGTDYRIGQLASHINSNRFVPFRVTALLATGDVYRRKAILGGVPILGKIDEVVDVAATIEARDVLVSAGSLDGRELRSLIDLCNTSGLQVRVLPRFEDAMHGTERIPLRPLNIEDLLRRDPVQLDTEGVDHLIHGKRVLVTGAGGSIGSEICRQVLRFHPERIILLGRGENRIHAIHAELREAAQMAGVRLQIEIGDITDQSRMRQMYRDSRPEIVFHAAAHKHVPLMELHPGEAVKNNIQGTRIIARLAKEHEVGHFVMVSTDKAVNPTSIMGCSKQLAERVVYNIARDSDTRFAVVRFGNVLGSAGSVIPVFQEQISQGGPITVTDERMTRYFMSIPEASQLVLQAASQCQGGEIFVLDMGEPVRIVQLAEDLLTLSGLSTDSIEIVYTGIRDGEKLYEELYFDEETTIPTKHPKVRAAYPGTRKGNDFDRRIDDLIAAAMQNDDCLRKFITQLASAYQADPTASRQLMQAPA